jgi:hypothetical protein
VLVLDILEHRCIQRIWSWVFSAQLHAVHQAWSGDVVVRCLEVEAMNSTQLHSISPT